MSVDDIPPKPEKPDPNECCGSGCVPCIFDYYYQRLEEWEAKYGGNAKDQGKLNSG